MVELEVGKWRVCGLSETNPCVSVDGEQRGGRDVIRELYGCGFS